MAEEQKEQMREYPQCFYVTKDLCDERHRNIALEIANNREDTRFMKQKIDKVLYLLITILGGLAVQLVLYVGNTWVH